ncbi:recombinase family protein [Clostridium algidicarnis]|uniref:recombinase family protein n=1 Tax=Clostridium algidicarnis TaxID=37659 RepID=UPI001C0C35E2|nr:recombinase family protein [Clostridium algidicarnis]MBU3195026.1 recombinase family protein [Clostridium algidicarnis]
MSSRTARNVTTIPASISRYTAAPINEQRKRRTAGYARVSTDSEEQLTSYEAQVDYYTNYIKSRDDWEFVEVYTDEGITATNTNKREGFKQMVSDALSGKIDLIVTKSVSRFARNTVDSLTTVRQLKEKGIEIYFEKENIWTLDSKGELLITIMSSLAQEESRSISENVTWGQRKRFSDGKVTVPFGHFLGYDRGEDGNLVLNEKEAIIVRRIFGLFLQGYSPHKIAKTLTSEGILSPGKKPKWNAATVRRMLENEKYKGDALLQKSYTVDFLTKKKKINEGEIPQYYVKNNHEAIIDPEVFDMVQIELETRTPGPNRRSGVSIFSSRIKCSECGSWYGSKVWHSTDKYRRTIYQCNHKYNDDNNCKTPHLDEESIKALFISAFNKLLSDRGEILGNFKLIKAAVFYTTDMEKEQADLQSEIEVVAGMIQQAIGENAHFALDQEEYQARYNSLVDRFELAKARHAVVTEEINEKQTRLSIMNAFLDTLRRQDNLVTEFDEKLWCNLVDYATVYNKEDIRFTFKNGTEIQA